MTQESRHQSEHLTNFPFPSDSGPYSGDMWAERERAIFTGDQYALQGPLVRYLNELEVTDNDATSDDEVYVDTGAAFVDGHWFHSDEQETFSIPAGPVGGRIDRVVLVENNTNATITAPAAAPALTMLLPNDLSEYDQATPGVPAYSARLAIVRGANVGGLPGLDQGATVYMVELYRYTMDNGPEFSSQADHRSFCVFSSGPRTRRFFVPCVGGYNQTLGADLEFDAAGQAGIQMPNNNICYGYGQFAIPTDYGSDMTIQAVGMTEPGAGNIRCSNEAVYGECAEAWNAHTDTFAAATVAVSTTIRNCIASITLSAPTDEDLVSLEFMRDGTHGGDTITLWYFSGWIVEYIALS